MIYIYPQKKKIYILIISIDYLSKNIINHYNNKYYYFSYVSPFFFYFKKNKIFFFSI